jgi:hypothetical protein
MHYISLINLWKSFRYPGFVSDDFEESLDKVTINYWMWRPEPIGPEWEDNDYFAKWQDPALNQTEEKQSQIESETKIRPRVEETTSATEDADLLPPFWTDIFWNCRSKERINNYCMFEITYCSEMNYYILNMNWCYNARNVTESISFHLFPGQRSSTRYNCCDHSSSICRWKLHTNKNFNSVKCYWFIIYQICDMLFDDRVMIHTLLQSVLLDPFSLNWRAILCVKSLGAWPMPDKSLICMCLYPGLKRSHRAGIAIVPLPPCEASLLSMADFCAWLFQCMRGPRKPFKCILIAPPV